VGVAVVDTSAVVAFLDRADGRHQGVFALFHETQDILVTSPLIVAELDYVVPRRLGHAARERIWDDLANGAYEVRWWEGAMASTLEIAQRLPRAGLADASLVALAHRLGTTRLVTLDEHFAQLDPSLELLPA